MRLVLAFIALTLTGFAGKEDGPFGIYMGMPADELVGIVRKMGEGVDRRGDQVAWWDGSILVLTIVPRQEIDFRRYEIVVDGDRRVCAIRAYRADQSDERFELFDRMGDRIRDRYGLVTEYDIDDLENMWASWLSDADHVLPDDVQSIRLWLAQQGTRIRLPELAVEYRFTNYADC